MYVKFVMIRIPSFIMTVLETLRRKIKYRIIHQDRYYRIYKPHHKYSNKQGRVSEHRYIYHIYLSILNGKLTYLPKNKEVHHIDGNGFNNNISNLQLITRNRHNKIHKLSSGIRICNFCKSKKTKKYNNVKNWYLDINGFLCFNCYHYIRYHIIKLNYYSYK